MGSLKHWIRGSACEGLSPRVRGNRFTEAGDVILPRWSIPACAGEPIQGMRFGQTPAEVTIPACAGEPASATNLMVISSLGLSPRVRGNLVGPDPPRRMNRTIPACAGEHHRTQLRVSSWAELSPRVRGNRPTDPNTGFPRGTIPACAGGPPFISHQALQAVSPEKRASPWLWCTRFFPNGAQSRRNATKRAGHCPRRRGRPPCRLLPDFGSHNIVYVNYRAFFATEAHDEADLRPADPKNPVRCGRRGVDRFRTAWGLARSGDADGPAIRSHHRSACRRLDLSLPWDKRRHYVAELEAKQ